MINPVEGIQAEYISAVLGRVALARAMERSDPTTREHIYPALLEARGAEEACRLELLRETSQIINAIETMPCQYL